MHHEEYRIRIRGGGEDFSGNPFSSPFFGKTESLSPIVGTLSTMLVKKSVLGVLNMVMSANNKCLSYQSARTDLI